jgi:hypothetical protein
VQTTQAAAAAALAAAAAAPTWEQAASRVGTGSSQGWDQVLLPPSTRDSWMAPYTSSGTMSTRAQPPGMPGSESSQLEAGATLGAAAAASATAAKRHMARRALLLRAMVLVMVVLKGIGSQESGEGGREERRGRGFWRVLALQGTAAGASGSGWPAGASAERVSISANAQGAGAASPTRLQTGLVSYQEGLGWPRGDTSGSKLNRFLDASTPKTAAASCRLWAPKLLQS